MPRRGKGQVPGGCRARIQPASPPAPLSVPQTALLLFPKSGYHRCLSKEDPGSIRQISCAQECLAVVKANGTVELFDRALEGASQKKSRSPRQIKLKKNVKVDLVDCEASCLLLLSSEGKVLEHSLSASAKSEPRLLKELGDRKIIQISCGDHHSLALTKGGELFAWGQNTCGQLGIGRPAETLKEPCKVEALQGIPLAKIAAGSNHSLALSVFGMVYSWGKNTFGQLGLGDTKDRYSPVWVKALEHTNTEFISCGGEHTAVISKGGLLCTFGAGSYGQLGHNSRHNEIFPRFVAELFGVRVSQVACGRWHTLVYIPELGEVHSFGSNADRQLGYGEKCDRLIPLPVELTVKDRKFTWEKSTSEDLIKIIAGENQSVVLLLKEENSYVNLNRTVARVEEEKVDKWFSNSNPTSWHHITENVKLIFSSLACLNGSFQKKREKHFRSFWEVAEVDMSAVMVFSDKIAAEPKIFTKVINSLKKLIKVLPSSYASPEGLRFFLIMPVLLRRPDIRRNSLLTELAHAFVTLQQKDQQVLETLCTNMEDAYFKDLVDMYQRLVSNQLASVINHMASCFDDKTTDQVKDLIALLKVLQMFYKINCQAGFKIHESNFYVPAVKLLPPLLNMNLEQLERISSMAGKIFLLITRVLTQFPFIFETEDKIGVYTLENTFHQSWANMESFDEAEELSGNELHVRRHHLLEDTWSYLRSRRRDLCRQSLKVCFVGEPGIDDGGVAQEFFTILRRELCVPEVQIFKYFEDSDLIWFSSKVPAEEDVYFLFGSLFGMAVYNKKIAAFPFPLALFKKMANIQPSLEDLKELSPVVGSNLQAVLDEDDDHMIEKMMLDFTIHEEHEASMIDVDLKENGANIPVTKYNRKEYVDAYVDYIFNKAVEKQFEDFMRGFHKGCPVNSWKVFLPTELQMVVCGHAKYDWEQLEKNTKYSGYDKSEETIKNFWLVFHDLPENSKKKFLAFLTGTDRIPAEGMKRFTFTIKDSRIKDPDLWYPEASTCCRILMLPRYTRRDIVENMLLFALRNCEKFGLQ